MKIYLSDLPQNVVKLAQYNHRRRILEDGIYTPEQIEEFTSDIPNQKIVDLEDALDGAIYEYIRAVQLGELNPNETYYDMYDMQDYSDSTLHTLESARVWLADFWNENPDEDMTDDEHEEWISEISSMDADSLIEALSGIDYTMEEIA